MYSLEDAFSTKEENSCVIRGLKILGNFFAWGW